MKIRLISLVLVSLLSTACSEVREPIVEPTVSEVVEEAPDPAIAENSRNAQRKSDLQQIAVALEFYKQDNESFPLVGGCMGDSELREKLSTYLTRFPAGEAGVSSLCEDEYFYHAYNDGKAYVLVAELEDAKGFKINTENLYAKIPGEAFFTDAVSLADLKSKLEEYVCEEGDDSNMFYVLMRE